MTKQEIRVSSCRRRRGTWGRDRNTFGLLLETGSAKNRPTLGRFEGDRGFHSTSRTGSARLGTHATSAGTFCLALLAMLGVVLELFVVKEKLLTRGEHKFGAAVVTLQDSVDKFHGRLPQSRGTFEIGHERESLPVPFPCL